VNENDALDIKPRDGEPEITEAMIEAGYRILLASGIRDDPLEADKLWVVEIYRAMRAVSPHAYCEPSSATEP